MLYTYFILYAYGIIRAPIANITGFLLFKVPWKSPSIKSFDENI